ncbi:hypothetical protein CTEN210_08293 [Chaetoceros tenuissimus]|uniref:Uncharacterized protein n=1 Tax=Chaetoceros tenuissimus TaxID=426638 RepID=A0AAD3CTJ4_9STRA|nr:hypothetical protein CTEN210_08293 [Chaetoceros tenuissimus]
MGDNDAPFEKATVNGTPMSVIFDQAVKLRTARDAALRSNFDKLPIFLQNSWIYRELSEKRDLPFDSRIDLANSFKLEGNEKVKEGLFSEALTLYEKSFALFRWVENTNPNWRNDTIKDEFMKEHSFGSNNLDEINQVNQLLQNVCNNIAIVRLKLKQFSLAISACDYSLQIDEEPCVKSLYLRAKARTTPKSAGQAEENLALKDLSSAIAIEPNNRTVRRELDKILRQKKVVEVKRKKVYSGFLQQQIEDPGSSCTEEENSNSLSKSIGRSYWNKKDDSAEQHFWKPPAQSTSTFLVITCALVFILVVIPFKI